jgi:isopentenyl phosphate kinase
VPSSFRAAYLIHGDDHGRIAERRAKLRAMAERSAGTAGVEIYEGDACSPGAIAGALSATRMLLLTDVEGVLDKQKRLIPEMTIADAQRYREDGTLTGGMIPKVETCIQAVEAGADGAVIIDGRVPHGILLEIFTEHGSGTIIRRG